MPPVKITTPFLSIEETAERAGVSPSRTREIIELADEIAGKVVSAQGRRMARHRAAKTSVQKRAAKTAHSKK